MNILFLSHTAMGGDFVVGSHQLSWALCRQGHRVVHVSAPITPGHLVGLRSMHIRRRFARCMAGGEVINGVFDVVPFAYLPWSFVKRSPSLRRVFYSPKRQIASCLKRRDFGDPDIVFIDDPRLIDVAYSCSSSVLVYRPTDLYAEMRGCADRIRLESEIATSRSFRVVAMSRPIAHHMRALGACNVVTMENGVDFEFFSRDQELPPDLSLPPGPKAIYVGSMDYRFSIDSVVGAALECPNVSFVLAGPASQKLAASTRHIRNILWQGTVDYERVPALLQACDLALLPMTNHPANAGRSPMKLYEYAAAGLEVVATESAELKARELPYVTLCAGPTEFASAVARHFAWLSRRDAERSSLVRRTAEKKSWSQKAIELIEYST